MGAKVAATCLHWSHSPQPVVSHSPSTTTLASCLSPSSRGRRSRRERSLSGGVLLRFVRSYHPLFGTNLRSKSRGQSLRLRRSCSSSAASEGFFNDEEFARNLEKMVQKKRLGDHGDAEADASSQLEFEEEDDFARNDLDFPNNLCNYRDNSGSRPFESEADTEAAEPEMISASSVEHRANSVDFPLSLRMLKRKKKQQQWEEGFREAGCIGGGCASCSVKKAFSSMVFIIRELHTYTLRMREILFCQDGIDLQGILARVHKEMHASFVWLFQHIFSRTPTLMVYVMILLANFTVYSMTTRAVTIAPPTTEETTIAAASESHRPPQKFDTLSVKGRTASVGGSGGGGGKVRPVAGATDGGWDGGLGESFDHRRTMFTDEMSRRVSSLGNAPSTIVKEEEEEELKLWNSIVEEASRMRCAVSLDADTVQRFVSPVSVEMEPEDYTQYFWTELLYQRAVAEEPDNPLILCNYAQFLYLVVHDLDRLGFSFFFFF